MARIVCMIHIWLWLVHKFLNKVINFTLVPATLNKTHCLYIINCEEEEGIAYLSSLYFFIYKRFLIFPSFVSSLTLFYLQFIAPIPKPWNPQYKIQPCFSFFSLCYVSWFSCFSYLENSLLTHQAQKGYPSLATCR